MADFNHIGWPSSIGISGRLGAESPAELLKFSKCHPYYTQKLGYFVFESAVEEVSIEDITTGIQEVFADSRPYFEALIRALPPQQRMVLRAIANEPTDKVMAKEYIRKHALGSTSAITLALKQLSAQDHIEENNGVWSVVDPIFGKWIIGMYR